MKYTIMDGGVKRFKYSDEYTDEEFAQLPTHYIDDWDAPSGPIYRPAKDKYENSWEAYIPHLKLWVDSENPAGWIYDTDGYE